MRFVVYAAVLNGDDNMLGRIDRLVDRLADQVHQIDIPDVDLLQESGWYEQARPMRKKVMMSAMAKPPRSAIARARGPHVKIIEVLDTESATLADRLAHTPAEVEDLTLLERRLFRRSPRPLLQLSRERRMSFTADRLRARDGEGELDALLRSIAQEL